MASSPPRAQLPVLTELPATIDTPRLRLRVQTDSDAEALFPYVSDRELTRHVSWAAHVDVAETRAWIEQGRAAYAAGSDMIWTIDHAGAPCGCVGLHGITWGRRALRSDKAELGYWIAPTLAGQGLMTEAAHAATRWAFETLGLNKVKVGCFEENLASRKVIEKVGFRYVGRLEDDVWRDGRWWAHLRFELLASEWADSSRTLRFSRPV